MNFRHFIGSNFNLAIENLISHQYFPLTRYFPRGVNVLYDIQRFSDKKKLPVLFDVGANIGQTATGLVKYFPASQIYCFEPTSNSFDILSREFSKFPNLHCIQKGLGSLSENVNIVIHDDSQLNTIVKNGPREDRKTGEEEIVLTTVDEFCVAEKISYIDFLKMDVQGWEMEVLLGTKDLLRDNRVRFVYAEVGFRRSDRDMQHFCEINDYLENQGFWFCGFYDQFRWGDKKEYVGFANALYLQPDFVEC